MTKLYTGKIFRLKKVEKIHYDLKNTINKYTRDGRGGMIKREDLGESVFILDERSKKVKILTSLGSIWISKYYLADEVIEQHNSALIETDACINIVAELLNDPNHAVQTTDKLTKVLGSLRIIRNSLEKD